MAEHPRAGIVGLQLLDPRPWQPSRRRFRPCRHARPLHLPAGLPPLERQALANLDERPTEPSRPIDARRLAGLRRAMLDDSAATTRASGCTARRSTCIPCGAGGRALVRPAGGRPPPPTGRRMSVFSPGARSALMPVLRTCASTRLLQPLRRRIHRPEKGSLMISARASHDLVAGQRQRVGRSRRLAGRRLQLRAVAETTGAAARAGHCARAWSQISVRKVLGP
jgi:hypothetical protein